MERTLVIGQSSLGVRLGAVVLGAVLVALAAQVAVPLPGTPVPMTLQPMAVLLVGGLLGARLGALSMILYLAMGAAGLPVFTPTVPLLGVARLFGPTGGYLLAYPVAAWATGWFADPGRQPGENESLRAGVLVNPGLPPGVREPWAQVALGWAVLFIVIGIVIMIGLSQVVPGWGGREWFVARNGGYEVIGFGLSTWIVGRLLKKYSWAELGWRRPAVTPWLRGVAIGAVMACVAIGLAVVLDGARIHFTG